MSSFKKSLRENFKFMLAAFAFVLPIILSGGVFAGLMFGAVIPAIQSWSVTAMFVEANYGAVSVIAIIIVIALMLVFSAVYTTIAEAIIDSREKRRKQRKCEA